MNNLDRLDRMLLPVPSSSFAFERQPVITSKRSPRFVDHTSCPMCGVDRVGIEFHGVLMTGVKVHTITAHSAEMRRVQNGLPRCLGVGLRMDFVDGVWKGAPSP